MVLQRLSNVAEPGLWVFRVDGPSVLSGGIYTLVCSMPTCAYAYMCM